MANLTEKDIKKGVLKGTDKSDDITIDSDYTGKKVTVKAGKGNDIIYASYYSGDLYAYAGIGSDAIYTGQGTNYLYGESGTNAFYINPYSDKTIISAGKGKAYIVFNSLLSGNDFYFDCNFKKVKNDLQITIPHSITGSGDKLIIIKNFLKENGEVVAVCSDANISLRENIYLTTSISGLKSANYITSGTLWEDIIGDSRNNTIKATTFGSYIKGGGGNDKIYGSKFFNELYGGDGNDTIYGGNNNDFISGGTGDDKLYGKQGENHYLYEGGKDTIYLEKGADTILLLNGFTIESKVKQGNDVLLNLSKDSVTGSIVLKNFFKITDVDETITVYKNDETENSDEIDLLPYNEVHFQASGKGTIKGTVYNDDIFGSEKADKIYAYAGNDTIDPSLGNDKIYAADSYSTILFKNGDGKDTIYGGYSNLKFLDAKLEDLKYERVKDNLVIKYSEKDSVTLSEYFNGYKANAEMIYGKDGSEELDFILENYTNKLEYHYGDGNVKFYSMPKGGNGVDLVGTEFNFDKVVKTKSGNNLVLSKFGAKNDKITIVDYYKNGIGGYIYLNGVSQGSLNDMMTKDPVTMTSTKYNGTIYNDVITGTTKNDIIKTKDGHDNINGSYGADTVYGGSGNDLINYQGYSDTGNEKIYGDAGNDTIKTGMSNDIIYGGDGNDYILSGSGIDKIYGDKGDDNIEAGAGNDIVDGGAGNDQIRGGSGNDSLKGGSGNDIIYSNEGNNTIYGGAGDDDIYINSATDKTLGDLVHGDAGNDDIYVEKGEYSKVYGDTGNDYITVYADATHNKIDGGKGNDTISVNAQYTEAIGGAGNDVITISANNCKVEAGSGNDIININGKYTEVDGGSGNDTYYLNGEYAVLEDSAGNDKYIVDSFSNLGNTYSIDDSKGKDTLKINYEKDDIVLSKFNVQVNQKGKIVDLDDINVSFSAEGEDGSIRVDEYFGSGCIERIETADGYYITKEQMQNVAQEVAAWLVENDFYSVSQVLMQGSSATTEQQEQLAFIYDNINWQM